VSEKIIKYFANKDPEQRPNLLELSNEDIKKEI